MVHKVLSFFMEICFTLWICTCRRNSVPPTFTNQGI